MFTRYKDLDDSLLEKELSQLPKQNELFDEINMDFRVNCIGNNGYFLIGQQLSCFKTKKLSLILANNKPGDFSSLFQEKLTNSDKIENLTLDVERNLMMDKYSQLLIATISKITNLKILNLILKHNSIRDEGIKTIKEFQNLNNLKHLRLDISFNSLKQQGSQYIGDSLSLMQLNTIEIDISQNQIGERGLNYIITSLKKIKSLLFVKFTSKKIGCKLRNEIMLKQNIILCKTKRLVLFIINL
ncbi:hypothetical protein ABPG74_013252 [Tetrahymena malaccensis]